MLFPALLLALLGSALAQEGEDPPPAEEAPAEAAPESDWQPDPEQAPEAGGTEVIASPTAVYLPGLPLPFEVSEDGSRWTLSPALPPALVEAGLAPGWILAEVDGVPFVDAAAAQRMIATGPARDVGLLFLVPAAPAEGEGEGEGEEAPAAGGSGGEAGEDSGAEPELVETLIRIPRSELVRVELLGVLPFPPELKQPPVPGWQETAAAEPVIEDAYGVTWRLDTTTGALSPVDSTGVEGRELPEVFWSLSPASWVLDTPDRFAAGDRAWAMEALADTTRVRTFQGQSADHLIRPTAAGLEFLVVDFPRGTPTLPECNPLVPETCLSGGRQVAQELAGRKGARKEALRQLTVACQAGVRRGCFEAVSLEDERLSEPAGECLDGDVDACNEVARTRYELDPDNPTDLVVGLLEFSCELEGSGSLGERLRRLREVGQGCMLLAEAYDKRQQGDLALLTLDQACVLGRVEACTEAEERRKLAFAAKIVRECESADAPLGSSCVELGRLLEADERVPTATLDAFDAFLEGCRLGEEQGCRLLGNYVDRWGIEHPRVMEAEAQLARSCKAGEAQACLGSGHLLVRHDPRTAPYRKALELFHMACGAGLAAGCEAGAEQRRIGEAKKAEAPPQLDMWQSACQLTSASGCFGLGEEYKDSKKTWESAFQSWTRACDLGHAPACTDLGQLVARKHKEPWQGEQTPKSYLGRACDNGDPEGCYWLAAPDVPRNGEPPEAAYLLLEQSCEGKFGLGCYELADVHLDRKTSFDDEIAARHLDAACASGEFEACKDLGLMYQVGKGVERDRQKANELLDKYRFNAKKKHVRIGLNAGIAAGAGGELELVVPISVGPAVSFAGAYSYIPGGGAALMLLRGDDAPDSAPDYTFAGGTLRIYGNPQARGAYVAAGVHQLEATGGDLAGETITRQGWSARFGTRQDNGAIFTGIEMGIGQYGLFYLNDFDEDETGVLPLILPTLGFNVGFAFL